LKAVNIHKLFPDSKTFVDMPMTKDPHEVWSEFEKIYDFKREHVEKSDLENFIKKYFTEAGTELTDCDLDDWKEMPKKLMRIQDNHLRKWALELNRMWLRLCRKVKPGVNSNRNSLIDVPYHFIVPGGRFREYYYWDAYWIIKGLIACEMYNTTKAMLMNFENLVDRLYGFIPNGGRIYYLRRSQPPFFAGMVYEYIEATKDYDFLKSILPAVIKELGFWQNYRTILIKKGKFTHRLFQYNTPTNVERPESFAADHMIGKQVHAADRPKLFQNIASAAESGWDFSSRWFQDKMSMRTIETTDIVPVDLNAIMCWNMKIISYLSYLAGDRDRSVCYEKQSNSFRRSMRSVFYDKKKGVWLDYNLRTERLNSEFYGYIAVPLFTKCYQQLNLRKSFQIVEFMNAFNLAHKWIMGNYMVYQKTGHMWEKVEI
uniref:Trehalase n=1 Tax=Dracunculus medinensis TaxID=318479 RepID=A0A158Q6B7_DRAME